MRSIFLLTLHLLKNGLLNLFKSTFDDSKNSLTTIFPFEPVMPYFLASDDRFIYKYEVEEINFRKAIEKLHVTGKLMVPDRANTSLFLSFMFSEQPNNLELVKLLMRDYCKNMIS